MTQHFIKETDFNHSQVAEIFSLARTLKANRGRDAERPLDGRSWALLFSKSSTRTRVSFEVAIRELGGHSVYLNQNDLQLGRGESVADTARVLSRYLHGLIVRTYDHSDLLELTHYGSIPVVNALTDFLHPCQIYTDAFTLAERWGGDDDNLLGSLRGRKIAFLGDSACNVPNSWILGANLFGMEISLAGPVGYEPGPAIVELCKKEGYSNPFTFTNDPEEAVRDADVVYTDVWISMGKESEAAERLQKMEPYAVTMDLFRCAKKDACFMHCLPAYVGKEVTQEVLDSPASIIFDQAENRLHVQKAILAVLARSGDA